MLIWIRFPFIRFLIFFISGIIINRFTSIPLSGFIVLYFILFSFYLLCLFVLKKERFIRYNLIPGIITQLLILISGLLISSLYKARDLPNGFSYNKKVPDAYSCKVMNINDKNSKCEIVARLHFGHFNRQWHEVSGKIILFIHNDGPDKKEDLHPGDQILVNGSPESIDKPKNPDQFNYAAYMADKNIYFMQYISSRNIRLIRPGSRFNIILLSGELNKQCHALLAGYIPDKETLSLTSALTLGSRDQMDPEMVADYTRAGISHVLAVSGLHVGILYLILFVILKPLYKNKTGAFLASLFIISFLIIYAFVTGLSPSVLRSVILFSFIETGRRMKRKSIALNTLAVSAIFLLCINPNYLYSAGFQLSYLAVTGIIYFQPRIYRLITFENDLVDYLWKLISVSIAAQLTTFPVSFYYFHSFPVYFLLANVVAIPAAFLILILGLSIMAFSFIPLIAHGIGTLETQTVHGFNFFISSIADFPGSQVRGIHLTLSMVLIIFFILLMLMALLSEKKVGYLYGILGGLYLFFLISFLTLIRSFHQQKIIFYNSRSSPLIELVNGRHGHVITDSALIKVPGKIEKIIGNHCLAEGHPFCVSENQKSMPGIGHGIISGFNLYVWEKRSILIIRDVKKYFNPVQKKILTPDYVVLSGNSGYYTSQLIKIFHPGLWIIDASCYRQSAEKAEMELNKDHLRFVSLKQSGAYTSSVNP